MRLHETLPTLSLPLLLALAPLAIPGCSSPGSEPDGSGSETNGDDDADESASEESTSDEDRTSEESGGTTGTTSGSTSGSSTSTTGNASTSGGSSTSGPDTTTSTTTDDPTASETDPTDPTGPSDPGDARWGQVENPSASCEVGPLPGFDALTPNSNLPDPFTKMDGSRITDASEWACRREEILQQGYEYILGEKPVPPDGSVSGTVSNSSITVQVNDGGSTMFTAMVNMNGATAPAPAIISYGGFGGPPVPNGVAQITFNPIETQGGSGPKNGPFYEVYGSDHPAGYLVAWAWQVSRILDVLEQDPSVIDPTRVGVTGCSRYGKGAFFAGVLDNRIALTIPVESGLGGTVGLRLVEVLDNYNGAEWPYHGISYVRWMSEVALGRFTSGNSAGADNTDRLPVDMHEMMGLIAPRGLYIVDNPSGTYAGLDRNSAWVTANVGRLIFEALGVGDHMSYEGASGDHCSWRPQYQASFDAMVDRFLLGDESADTGRFNTDLGNAPNPAANIDWEPPTLSGSL